MTPPANAGFFLCVLSLNTMEQQFVMISKDEVEQQMRQLKRAINFCVNARSSIECDLNSEPTESYPGASGYACQTMKCLLQSLESNMKLSEIMLSWFTSSPQLFIS